MLGVVYMFSDVPFMQHYYMYQIVRIGRKRWAIGQIVSIIFQSLFLMFFHLSVSILWIIRHCEWKLEWGKLLHTVALTNASAHYGFLFEVPYSAIQKYSPQEPVSYTHLDVYKRQGRWKALHYYAKRFFAPVMISCQEESWLTQMCIRDRICIFWSSYNLKMHFLFDD